jgi:hypothetical protein
MPPVLIGTRCNRRVTCDSDPSNDRSESELVTNPLDAYNLVGASKRFTDPAHYQFSLAPYASFDGGQTWSAPSLALPSIPGETVAGTSDPTVCFDDHGNAYLLGLIFSSAAGTLGLLGMAMYMSTDGGRSWGAPNAIHQGPDDKQAMAADVSPSSPHKGNVYAAWDLLASSEGGIVLARSTDHGASWTGTEGRPAGAQILPSGSFPSITVDESGRVWVFGVDFAAGSIVYVTSTDGGSSFSGVQTAASGITILGDALLPFRAETIPSSCASGNRVVVAWADSRDGDPHVYYRRTNTSGSKWDGGASGGLLTAAASSAAGQADIMPQLAATPDGAIGCAFYEYGPKTAGGAGLISVELAVSSDGAKTFADRVEVTDQPWDPTVDPVTDENGNHFIGDYFGFAASRLGFFPFWTDTRSGVQEIYTSRLAVRPADLYIRDSASDTGAVPSPGNHWEAPDLIVSTESSGPASWTDDPLVHDGVTDFYVYGRAYNLGPNPAPNVTLSVVVGNFPSLLGMPGSEFRYPQDWYQGDWETPAVQADHLYLGESAPASIPAGGGPVVLGPIRWPAAQIPAEGSWHPCLLAEVRADNDDSAGGPNGCPISASSDPCYPGAFFWGVNNTCQRNLTYAPVEPRRVIEFPFIIGSRWSDSRFTEVIVDRGKRLEGVPMTLRIEPLKAVTSGHRHHSDGDDRPGILMREPAHLSVLSGAEQVGELWAKSGSIWRPPVSERQHDGRAIGAFGDGAAWRLAQRRASVGLPTAAGQRHLATLRFAVPADRRDEEARIQIWQRNDRQVVVGAVTLILQPHKPKPRPGPRRARTTGAGRRRQAAGAV